MSQAKFITTKTVTVQNFKVNSKFKETKKRYIKILFSQKNSTTNQIMIVNRTKRSYKILEKSRGLTAVFILTGKMKIKIKHKYKKTK